MYIFVSQCDRYSREVLPRREGVEPLTAESIPSVVGHHVLLSQAGGNLTEPPATDPWYKKNEKNRKRIMHKKKKHNTTQHNNKKRNGLCACRKVHASNSIRPTEAPATCHSRTYNC